MEGETWGLNDFILRRPVKLTFEMHNIEKYIEEKLFNIEKEIEEINRLGIPVITQKKHKFLPTAIPFPINEMPMKYFTSTMAYMTAYAIYRGATEIEMYGVALYLKREYTQQRSCLEFWIGYAKGKGIKVTVHGQSTLFSTKPYVGLYGYDWDDVNGQRN